MSKKSDSLGDRMKAYESIPKNYLTRRIPAIIRLDGKAFHTFTRGMRKPFDRYLMDAMQGTMKYLCENIQGCVLGYTQSDEITLVLTDYATVTTDAWFGYNVQKMTSVAASTATMAFNETFAHNIEHDIIEYLKVLDEKGEYFLLDGMDGDETWNYLVRLREKYWSALFDARAFSVPKDEVCNCLIWRQQDATRNSVEAVGQANFSQRQLHGKSCSAIQDMLFTEKGINWNDFPTDCKRGSCCVKRKQMRQMEDPRDPGKQIEVERRVWEIDHDIPIFTQDRDYIESLL